MLEGEGKIIKELGVFKDGIVLGYSFLRPKTINRLFKQSGTLKIYMGLFGTMENWNTLSCHQSFTNIFRLQQNTEYFTKGLEKCNLLSNYLCKDVENLDDLGCPKISKLLNNSDIDWDCSKYPYRHKKTFHCAEKRAYAYGT